MKILAFILFCSHALASFYSQCGQDRYIFEYFFPLLKQGVFVDIGAHDGVTFSNTFFFEKNMDWTGLCIEPIPEVFEILQKKRSADCVNGCISTSAGKKKFWRIWGKAEMLSGLYEFYDPKHIERIQREVAKANDQIEIIDIDCFLINDLLEEHGISHIHFLSIDTEGGELEILKTLDFLKYEIDVIAVENNYNDPNLALFLESQNFQYITNLVQDMIFLNKKFYP